MVRVFLCSLISLVSTVAFANFNGNWIGTNGRVTGAVKSSCGPIQLSIIQTATRLTIENSDFTCGEVTFNANTLNFKIANGVLFLGLDQVGSVNSTSASYNISSNEDATSGRLSSENGVVRYSVAETIQGFGTYKVQATIIAQ